VKSASSVLEIKEFVPGRPWGSQQQHPSGADAAVSVPTSSPTGAASQGLGVRRSSLADMEKLVATSGPRLSTSEWSLDGNAGESAGGAGGSKGIVDPAGSLPALWTPLETSAGTPVPASKGMLMPDVILCTDSVFAKACFCCTPHSLCWC